MRRQNKIWGGKNTEIGWVGGSPPPLFGKKKTLGRAVLSVLTKPKPKRK